MPIVVVLAGLLALQLVWLPKKSAVERQQYEDKVNLALRQVGDRLLKEQGNLTGTIPPVRKAAGNEFVLQLDSPFHYDSLPVFLKTALAQYHIEDDYLVTVKDCDAFKLLLGFARQDVEQNGTPPCGGRDQHIQCSNIHLVFPNDARLGTRSSGWQKAVSMGILVALAYLLFLFYKMKKQPAARGPEKENADAEPAPANVAPGETFRFGQSVFDLANQTLYTGGQRQDLTFREAKLLHLFCQHANQLLDRNFILQEVWEDEGIIVGRSLDVFVSRLRKILKNDGLVKITNVHGVGYRFEITDNQSLL